jgi:hypothetical protein
VSSGEGSAPRACTHTCKTTTGELPDHLRVQPVLGVGDRGGGAGAGARGGGGQGVEARGLALVLAVGEDEAC